MTTDFSKATPRPWKLAAPDDTTIIGANEEVAHACGDYDNYDDFSRMEANAALIVAAVNAYGAGQADAVAWQDIGSAPKDGTEVQLAGMTPDGPRVTAGYWLIPEPPAIGDCGGECRCPEYGDPEEPCWVSNDGGFCEPWMPTHWAPLLPHPSLAYPPAASARIADLHRDLWELLHSATSYMHETGQSTADIDSNPWIKRARAALTGAKP